MHAYSAFLSHFYSCYCVSFPLIESPLPNKFSTYFSVFFCCESLNLIGIACVNVNEGSLTDISLLSGYITEENDIPSPSNH